MELEILNNIEALESYKTVMEEILAASNNDNPFLTYEWIVRWWNYFGKGRELCIAVIKNDNEAVGLCPLMITKKERFREANFVGYPQASYMDIIVRNEFREDVIIRLVDYFQSRRDIAIFDLHGMPESSQNLALFQKHLQNSPVRYFIRSIHRYYIQRNGRDFPEYFKSRSRHHSIKNIKKNETRFRELGNLTWHRQNPDDLDVIFELHDKRWLKKNDGSGFSAQNARHFFKSLAQDENIPSFQAVVFTLQIDNKTIGFAYGFEYHHQFLFYRLAHDDDFAVYGPGKIVVRNLIQYCFEQGFTAFDFMRGYERYKEEWSDSDECINSLIFSANKPKSRFVFFRYASAEQIKRFFKKSRLIVQFKKTTYGKLKYYFSADCHRQLIRQIANAIKNEGYFAIVKKLFYNAVYNSETYGDLFYTPSSGPGSAVAPVRLRPAEINDLEPLGNLMNCTVENITRRFYKGQKCLLILRGNTIVGYAWLCFSKAEIRGLVYPFSKKYGVCIYDVFVCKAYRGIYSLSAALQESLNYLRENSAVEIHLLVNLREKKLVADACRLGFEIRNTVIVSRPLFKKCSIQYSEI